MELPNLGKHCSHQGCKQLDFLPYNCDLCKNVYCGEHRKYEEHHCKKVSERVDKFVPVCPICNDPVPVKPSENVDYVLNRHIESGCRREKDAAKASRASRQCNKCKKVELIPIQCGSCGLVYCNSHRIAEVHSCVGLKKQQEQPMRQIGPFRIPVPQSRGSGTDPSSPAPTRIHTIKVAH